MGPLILILDLFVKPEEEVTDYLTLYSGISPETWENESWVRREECVRKVKRNKSRSGELKGSVYETYLTCITNPSVYNIPAVSPPPF